MNVTITLQWELTQKLNKKSHSLIPASNSGQNISSGQQTVSKLSASHPQVELLVIASISMMNVAPIVSSKNLGDFGCRVVGIPQNKTHVRVNLRGVARVRSLLEVEG
jgi:hypothetical protein